MGERRSNRFGMFRAVIVFAHCGLLSACSGLFGEPASVVSPVYKISGAPATDTSGPAVAEIRPGAAPGELRLVVVPPDRPVK
jgi:hypothetical protein